VSSERTAPGGPDSIVLRHMQSMRRDFAAVLENQRRDRELLVRLFDHIERGFARVDTALADIRHEVGDLKSDVLLLENNLLTRHNELLGVVLRLDEMDVERDGPEASKP
jgi:hypothetical protein